MGCSESNGVQFETQANGWFPAVYMSYTNEPTIGQWPELDGQNSRSGQNRFYQFLETWAKVACCYSVVVDPVYMSRKIRMFRRINSIREINVSFDSCKSCKRLETSRLHDLHESKHSFVSRIEFIRSKLSIFSAHVGIRGQY